MTKISFFRKEGKWVGFQCVGHTGYGRYGKDILCSAISSITQSCMIGLDKVLGIDIQIDRNDENGYLKIELPDTLDKESESKVEVLMDTCYLSLLDLKDGYSKYISMEVIE